jgi:hypothetical protein
MEERMTVDRRSFFKGGIIATLFAGIPGAVTALAGQVQKRPVRPNVQRLYRPKSLDNLAHLSMDSFSPFVDTSFTVRGLSVRMAPITMTLTRVVDLRQSPEELGLARQGREFFSMEFSGPSSRLLAQGMYSFSNESLGEFYLLIVPGSGSTYQATVNRLYS